MRILLVDDHALFREALLHIIKQFDAQAVVIEAATSQQALQLAAHYHDLDLILLDLALPGVDGLSALPELRRLAPSVPLVVLSASESPADVQQALESGAAGYVPKSCSSHEMIAALRLVLAGEIYLPAVLLMAIGASQRPQPLSRDPKTSELTPRQLEVLHWMGQGLSNKRIGKCLSLTEGTVKLHVAAILRVLNTRNRTQAVVEASRRGLLATAERRVSA